MENQYIKRTVETRVRQLSGMFPAVAITGPRQSGKTTLLKHTFPDYAFCSLDDTRLRSQAQSDPEIFLNNFQPPVIIDEIQYAPNLLSHIKMRIDENPGLKGRYLLTGSQQFLMIKGLTETLAGRVGLVNVYPLSASEITGSKNQRSGYEIFKHACLRGTYPEPAVNPAISMREWYIAYLNTYIERDARNLYNIGNLNAFDTFIRILAARPGQSLNMSSLATDVKVAVNTIKNWLSILNASGIIHLLYPYYANVRTQLVKSPRVYFTDTGLVAMLNRVNKEQDIMYGTITGPLFENFIVMEAVKKIANTGSDDRLFYFRNSKGVEIDLIIERRDGLMPIEIKATASPGIDSAAPTKAAGKILKGRLLFGYIACLRDGVNPLSKEMSSAGVLDILDLIGGEA